MSCHSHAWRLPSLAAAPHRCARLGLDLGLRGAWIAALVLLATGCRITPQQPVQNPLFVATADPEPLWNALVDVVDDHFLIDREQRVRNAGGTLTEGRIDTFPQIGATLLEPWLGDAVGGYEKLEGTLQSMRRRAYARVIPAEGGFLVDLAVFKELEDVPVPEHATAGASIFRYDDSLGGYSEPVGGQAVNIGWIPQGRDALLEAKMLDQLRDQIEHPPHAIWRHAPGHGFF